ncbi:MAG: hypothetical protein COB76_04615 [Alphaproteobacteria bacterium]|nr:MAG: hypothetical protein COB76_04615 [Alphaproteobacteria bacterium]
MTTSAHVQRVSVGHIRDLTRSKFGKKLTVLKDEEPQAVLLPNFRTFARFIANWKNENAALYLKTSNPDAAKNKHMMAFGKADADVTRLNQLWEAVREKPLNIAVRAVRN